ncbi:unnamed protein product, partial [Adineta steineri]
NCPWAIKLRELRADSYLKSGDLPKAVSDLKATAKLIPDNTQAFLKISQLLYSMCEAVAIYGLIMGIVISGSIT